MPFVRLSDSAQAVLARAQDLAALYLHSHVEPEHVFLALLRDEDSSARTILEALRVSVETLANQFEAHLLSLPTSSGAHREYSARSLHFLSRCQAEAISLQLSEIRPALLLIALLQEEQCFLADRLREHGLHGEMIASLAEAQRRLEVLDSAGEKNEPQGRKHSAVSQGKSDMDFYNFFSFSAKKAIFRASEICQQFNNQYLEPEHVMYSILNLRSCSGVQVLHQLNVNLPKLTYTLEAYLYEHSGSYKSAPQFSKRTINLLDASFSEVRRLQHREIGTTHLLIALAQERGSFLAGLFDEHELNAKKIRDTFAEHLKGFGAGGAGRQPGISSEVRVRREQQGSEGDYNFRLSQILDCGDGFGAHFNSEALLALALAASTARRLRHTELGVAHVVLGLLSLPFDPQRSLTESLSVDSALLLTGLYRQLAAVPPVADYGVPQLGDGGLKLLESAFGYSIRRRTGCITALHLLLACMDNADGELRELLDSAGLSVARMEAAGQRAVEEDEGSSEKAEAQQSVELPDREQLIHDAREMAKLGLNTDYLKDMGVIAVPQDMAAGQAPGDIDEGGEHEASPEGQSDAEPLEGTQNDED